eukprot:CAMPEP_0181519962 /NCGR_PEP_ID=MMETSP1110-20121109/66060_1 /TAXON_ID=174948 /ORGANISM="Symbiodinium sp., Strain CCMP421" /LENGTH=119 /DNA_ID=CAMNT_0023650427 /DNA_START=20 /DNA_END=379 /DNA_ORIENTATION=-
MASDRFLTPSNMEKLASRNSLMSSMPSPLVSAAENAASSIQPSSKSSLTSEATVFWAEIHSSGERKPSPETSKSVKMLRRLWRIPAWYRGPILALSSSAFCVCSTMCAKTSARDKPISW